MQTFVNNHLIKTEKIAWF